MRNAKSSHNVIKCQIVVFLCAFIPRMICAFFMEPVKVLMDEICTLNGAAYCAGLDWSKVVGEGSYYGFGFYALLFFIFKVSDNPNFIYHFIITVLALIQSSTALVCFHIFESIFKIKERKWSVIASITCSYMVVSRAIAIVNEHPMILITWILIWIILLMCEHQDHKSKKAIYTFLVMLLLTYSLLIHTRAVTYWIAFFLLIILYGAVYRKCLVSIPIIIGTVAAAVPTGKYLIKNYQDSIWSGAKTIVNAAIDVSSADHVFKIENINSVIDIILGEINTIGVYTGGISYFAIVVCIYCLAKCMKKKESAGDNGKLFAIVIFCGACVGITITGMIFSWGNGVIYGVSKNITYDYYPYKALTYIRYFGPYLGPLLMVLLFYVKKNGKEVCKLISVAVLIVIPIQLYWVENIIPMISHNSVTNQAFMLFTLWNENKELESGIYYGGIMFMIFSLFMYGCFIYYKKEMISIMLILLVLFLQYVYGVYAQDTVWAEKNFIQADGGYEWVRNIEKDIEIPNEIYVKDNVSASHHKSYYIYQFMLNRYVIIPGEPEEDLGEAILFENTSENIETLCNIGFKYMQLDENEYVFVKGEELLKNLHEAGWNLK